MLKWIAAHPYLFTGVVTWVFTNVVTVLVSSLPAPTAQSKPGYVYWFKVANGIVGNLQRAKSTAIEQSPNFLPAVEAYLANLQNVKNRIKEPLASAANAAK